MQYFAALPEIAGLKLIDLSAVVEFALIYQFHAISSGGFFQGHCPAVLLTHSALGRVDDTRRTSGEIFFKLLEVGEHLLVGIYILAVNILHFPQHIPVSYNPLPLLHLDCAEPVQFTFPDFVQGVARTVINVVGEGQVLADKDNRVRSDMFRKIK